MNVSQRLLIFFISCLLMQTTRKYTDRQHCRFTCTVSYVLCTCECATDKVMFHNLKIVDAIAQVLKDEQLLIYIYIYIFFFFVFMAKMAFINKFTWGNGNIKFTIIL